MDTSPDGQGHKGDLHGTQQRSGFRRRTIIISAIVGVIIVLGLALGLGLGLGLHHGEGRGEGEETPTPSGTSTPVPTPSSTPAGVWQPAVNASWQIILSKTLDIDESAPSVEPDVAVFDIDMFLHQNNTIIDSLHKLGKKVICYFSAGSYEDYRPDSWQFKKADLGSELDGWPGEYWLNISSPDVRDIMATRIEIASQIGCDAVDPDNVDGFQNENGFDLTAQDSIDFVKFLAKEARNRKLGVGLKNAGDIISDVLSVVQFQVNEQCAEYDECDTFAAFIDAGKPVFHIEYPKGTPDSVSANALTSDCSASDSDNFSTVIKTMDLDGWVEYCNGQKAETAVTS